MRVPHTIFSRLFARQATERAVKTAAQTVLTGLVIGEGFNAFDLDPMLALGFAAGGALFSILTSIASAPFGPEGPGTV